MSSKINFRLAIFVAVSVFILRAYAEPTIILSAIVKPTKHQAGAHKEKSVNQDYYTLNFKLFVKNVASKKITIPTAGFRRASEAGEDYIKSELIWDFNLAPDSSVIIPSDAELHLVLLRPGESAVLEWSETEFTEKRFQQISVQIRIDESFAHRFEIPPGVFTTTHNGVRVDRVTRYDR